MTDLVWHVLVPLAMLAAAAPNAVDAADAAEHGDLRGATVAAITAAALFAFASLLVLTNPR